MCGVSGTNKIRFRVRAQSTWNKSTCSSRADRQPDHAHPPNTSDQDQPTDSPGLRARLQAEYEVRLEYSLGLG